MSKLSSSARTKALLVVSTVCAVGVLSAYWSRLSSAKLVVINDTRDSKTYIVDHVGLRDQSVFSLGAGDSETLYFSPDQMPKSVLRICSESGGCLEVEYMCRGFGGCSRRELTKTIRHSNLQDRS